MTRYWITENSIEEKGLHTAEESGYFQVLESRCNSAIYDETAVYTFMELAFSGRQQTTRNHN